MSECPHVTIAKLRERVGDLQAAKLGGLLRHAGKRNVRGILDIEPSV